MGAMVVLWSFLGVLKHLLAPPLRCPCLLPLKKKSAAVFRHRHTLAHPWLRPWCIQGICRSGECVCVCVSACICTCVCVCTCLGLCVCIQGICRSGCVCVCVVCVCGVWCQVKCSVSQLHQTRVSSVRVTSV